MKQTSIGHGSSLDSPIDGYDEERVMKSLLLPAANFFHNLLLAAETGLGFD